MIAHTGSAHAPATLSKTRTCSDASPFFFARFLASGPFCGPHQQKSAEEATRQGVISTRTESRNGLAHETRFGVLHQVLCCGREEDEGFNGHLQLPTCQRKGSGSLNRPGRGEKTHPFQRRPRLPMYSRLTLHTAIVTLLTSSSAHIFRDLWRPSDVAQRVAGFRLIH